MATKEERFANPLELQTAAIYAEQEKTNGVIRLEHAVLTPTGIQIRAGFDHAEWERLGKAIQGMSSAMQWYLGDWMAYGYRVWGKTYEAVAEEFGYKTKTLYEYAHVCANVDFSIRNGKLSFAHHQVVADREPADQYRLLDEAVVNSYTVRQLRAAMEGTTALLDDPHQKRMEKTLTSLAHLHPSRIDSLNIQKAQTYLGYVEAARKHLDELERKLLNRID